MMSNSDKLFIVQNKIDTANPEIKWTLRLLADGVYLQAAKSQPYEEEIDDEDFDDEEEDFDDEDFDDEEDFDDDDFDDDEDFDDEFEDEDLEEDYEEEDRLSLAAV